MSDFDIKAVLETLCAERGWEIKPNLCYFHPKKYPNVYAMAQWETEGTESIKIGSYRINANKNKLEYLREIDQIYWLIEPESLIKIEEIFEEIEEEARAVGRMMSLFKLKKHPWCAIAARMGLTKIPTDDLMEVEKS